LAGALPEAANESSWLENSLIRLRHQGLGSFGAEVVRSEGARVVIALSDGEMHRVQLPQLEARRPMCVRRHRRASNVEFRVQGRSRNVRRFDVLYNNAGHVGRDGQPCDHLVAPYSKDEDINVLGVLLVVNSRLRPCRDRRRSTGEAVSIINVASFRAPLGAATPQVRTRRRKAQCWR